MDKDNLPGLSPLWLMSLALMLGIFLATALPLVVLTKDIAPADWLGFSGGIIGAACTIFAGWLAYSAVQTQIRDARNEARTRQIAELTAEVGEAELDLDRLRLTESYLRTFLGNFRVNLVAKHEGGMTKNYLLVRRRALDFVSSSAARAPHGYGERVLTVMNRLEAIGNRITEVSASLASPPIERTFDGILFEAVTGIEAIADQIAEDIPVYQARWLLKFNELQNLRD
jgi:hypothetical protein